MRTLWIGLLTLLARGLQIWSEAVTRRLENVKHSAAGGDVELATSDHPSDEVDGPPADWLERIKSAQPPTHWRATVSQARSDSIKSIEPSVPDIQNEPAPADRPIEPQRSEESAAVASPLRSPVQPLPAVRPLSRPNYRAADTTRTEMQAASDQSFASTQTIDQSPLSVRDRVVTPAKSAATRSPVKSVRPTNAAHSTSNVPAHEADLITPEVEATAPVDEVIAARAQTPASQRERRPTTSTQLIDDARTHSTTTERAVDDQALTDRLADAERDMPDLDQSQRAPRVARFESLPAKRMSPIAADSPPLAGATQSIDLVYPIESLATQGTAAESPHRSDFAMNDRVAASWPAGTTLQPAHTWAATSGFSLAEPESSAIENQWPTLLDERPTDHEEFETVLRERERLRRLDLEQRGLGWSA